jgi:hypothetical protein
MLIVAELYIQLYDAILADNNPALGHGREGFYFGANGENFLYDLGKAISEALMKLGRANSPEVTSFTKEEADKYFGGVHFFFFCSFRLELIFRLIGWFSYTWTCQQLALYCKPVKGNWMGPQEVDPRSSC